MNYIVHFRNYIPLLNMHIRDTHKGNLTKHTVVVAGNFFVKGGFSPMDAPTHFRVIAAWQKRIVRVLTYP